MKRTSKELKRIARDILNDRYRVPMAAFAATTLIATLIESPFSFSMGDNPTNMQLVISLIAELLISVVSFVLGCGVAKIHLSMTRGNDFLVRDIFDPFKKNTDRFFIAGFLFLLMIFVSMIPVIGGFTYAVIADFSVVSIVIAAATGILSLILSCYFMLTYHLSDISHSIILSLNVWKFLKNADFSCTATVCVCFIFCSVLSDMAYWFSVPLASHPSGSFHIRQKHSLFFISTAPTN